MQNGSAWVPPSSKSVKPARSVKSSSICHGRQPAESTPRGVEEARSSAAHYLPWRLYVPRVAVYFSFVISQEVVVLSGIACIATTAMLPRCTAVGGGMYKEPTEVRLWSLTWALKNLRNFRREWNIHQAFTINCWWSNKWTDADVLNIYYHFISEFQLEK